MNILSTKAPLQLPSIQQFIDNLEQDLIDRRSTLIILPSQFTSIDIWSSLRARLSHNGFFFKEISLFDIEETKYPAVAIAELLGVDWNSATRQSSVTDMIASMGHFDILQLYGFEKLSASRQEDWITFLTSWARDAHTIANTGRVPVAICIITSAESILPCVPESDLYLAIHWWWSFPSALETHLLCRLSNTTNDWNAAAQWREELLPTIVGNDISLIEYLWDKAHLDVEILMTNLCCFANERNWDRETLKSWGVEEFIVNPNHSLKSLTTSPPKKWQDLWAHGAVSWTPEYGLELHISALAILGRKNEIVHRLWRGQSRLLLPLIDQVRLTLCDYLTKIYGVDWPIRWERPASDEEYELVSKDPLACQWGYLDWMLKNCTYLRTERQFLPVASLGRSIRNEIAHYRPVAFGDFENFWFAARRLQEQVSSQGVNV